MIAATIRRRGAGLRQRHGQTLAGILDQGVIGLGNLAMGLIVLQGASKEQYGVYGLCYTTLILLNGFGNAVFGTQLTAAYHDVPAAGRNAFSAAMLRAEIAVILPPWIVALAVLLLLPGSAIGPETRLVLAATLLACPGAMVCDFLRLRRFVARRAPEALLVDALLIAGWLGATLGLRACGLAAHLAALAGYGAATLAAAGLGLWMLPRAAAGTPRHAIRDALAAGWRHGRWALGGAAVTALQNQAHVYLLAALATAEAVAELNAARMLLMPMSLLIAGVNATLLPDLVRRYGEGGPVALRRRASRALAAMLLVIGPYVLLLVLAEGAVVRLVLGGRYADIGPLVVLWGVVLMIQAVDANWSLVLQAARRFRDLTVVNLWTVVPVLAAAVPAILVLGARGNLVALAGGYAAMCLLLRGRIARALPLAPMDAGPRVRFGEARS